ncbi:MAG: CheR family methyltransferase [Myxococcota bacterium]
MTDVDLTKAGLVQRIEALARPLDPDSRYIRELLRLLEEAPDVPEFRRRLEETSRGARHAGAEVFRAMSLEEQLLANLITPETSLFRFSEGELEALDRELLPRIHGRTARVLIVPCSHGEEAYTIAAYLLKQRQAFHIDAFDVQPALIEEAKTGRLSFGYPAEHLAQPGRVAESVLRHIRFSVGDAFQLPLDPEASYEVVLCRNFVGYFRADVAGRLVSALTRRVAPGGILLLDSFCVSKIPEITVALGEAGARQLYGRPVFQLPGGA